MDPQGLEQIAHRHGVELILEFGSMVTGHVHPRSDVDLAVLLDRPGPSFEKLADHEYDEVDPRRVHEALGTATQDVSTYLRAVEDYVKRTPGDWPVSGARIRPWFGVNSLPMCVTACAYRSPFS